MDWPGIESFTVKYDGTDTVYAAHINALQNSIVGIESTVGATPLTVDDGVNPATDWTTIQGILDRFAAQIKYITGKSSWRTYPDYNLASIGTFGTFIVQGAGALGGGGALSGSPLSITLNTPGTLTVSSTNSSATNHTHEIEKTTVGAANKIVATDATGKIVATGVLSNAAVEIYGNLNVNSAMYVDYTNRRVGINCIADAQFALDVNGNFRARGYIVGKHAITLSSATLLCHFDGPLPYNTNKTGDLTSVFGHKGTPLSSVVFNEGKFNKAIQINYATTNLVVNGTFESGVTSWSIATSTSFTQDANNSHSGTKSAKIIATTGGVLPYVTQTLTVTSGAWHTLSAWIYIPEIVGSYVVDYAIRLFSSGGSASIIKGISDVPTGRWVRIQCSLITDTTTLVVVLAGYNNTTTVYYDDIQIEQRSICTPYQSSTSAVSANRIDYSSAPLNLQQGSIGFWRRSYALNFSAAVPNLDWVNYGEYNAAHYQWLNIQNAASGNIISFIYDNKENATTYSMQTTLHNDGEWHFYVFTWENGGYLKIYSDGVLVATDNVTLVAIKNAKEYATLQLHRGLYEVEEFFVAGQALAPDAIKAIYESDAPLFIETSNWQFTIPDGLTWADETGFWVKDGSDNAVFGACALDGITWGGLTLNKGDLLIGNTNHYLFWDTSVPELKFYSTGGKLQINKEGVFGLDGSSKPTFSLLSAAKTVNSESLLAGDVLFGDNSTGKANIKFTAGDILLRTGTINSLKLTNDGLLTRLITSASTIYQDQWYDTVASARIASLFGYYSGVSPLKKAIINFTTYVDGVTYNKSNLSMGAIDSSGANGVNTTWYINDTTLGTSDGVATFLGFTSTSKFTIRKDYANIFVCGGALNDTIAYNGLTVQANLDTQVVLKVVGGSLPYRVVDINTGGPSYITKNAYCSATATDTWTADVLGTHSLKIAFKTPSSTESFVLYRGSTSGSNIVWTTSAFWADAVNNRFGINKDNPAVTLDVDGAARFSQTLQITGALTPADGEGIELAYISNQGYITTYRRDATAAFKPLNIRGDPVYFGTSTPTVAVTPLGGIAVKFTAGENLTKGQIVQSSQTTSDRVIKAAAAGDMPIGIVYADATSGNNVWVVVSGLAEVKFASGVACPAGYVAYVHATTAGEANCAASIPGTTEHWREIGHIKLTGTTGSLGTCILHFN